MATDPAVVLSGNDEKYAGALREVSSRLAIVACSLPDFKYDLLVA